MAPLPLGEQGQGRLGCARWPAPLLVVGVGRSLERVPPRTPGSTLEALACVCLPPRSHPCAHQAGAGETEGPRGLEARELAPLQGVCPCSDGFRPALGVGVSAGDLSSSEQRDPLPASLPLAPAGPLSPVALRLPGAGCFCSGCSTWKPGLEPVCPQALMALCSGVGGGWSRVIAGEGPEDFLGTHAWFGACPPSEVHM